MGKQRTVLIEGDIIGPSSKKKKTATVPKDEGQAPDRESGPGQAKAPSFAPYGATKGKQKEEKAQKKEKVVAVQQKEAKAQKEEKKEKKREIEKKTKKGAKPYIIKRGKKYKQAEEQIDKNKLYKFDEAVDLLKEIPQANFDASLEVHVRLGIDIDQAGQKIRSLVVLPHNIGKSKKILVICSDQKQKEAKKSGADYAGGEELVKKIKKGWIDFDIVIATPDMMGQVGQLGKILGQKGLMPNPKSGTVTQDVGKLVGEIKSGKIEIKSDDYGIVHQMIGKISFDNEKLKENFQTLMDTVMSSKPTRVKGDYIKSITLCSTHSSGIRVRYED